MVEQDHREELTDLVCTMLSDQAWKQLLEAARDIAQSEQTIHVQYTWGSVERPWSAERVSDTVQIVGPLLYFPITEAPEWDRLAALLSANGDFEAPRITA